MERAGTVQVDGIDQLFAAPQVFGAHRHMPGDRVAVVTNGGGSGVLAVDAVLAILAPLALTESTAIAEKLVAAAGKTKRPVLACWMGAASVAEAQSIFAEHMVPSFTFPGTAVEALSYLAAYHRNQKLLMRGPPQCRSKSAHRHRNGPRS